MIFPHPRKIINFLIALPNNVYANIFSKNCVLLHIFNNKY